MSPEKYTDQERAEIQRAQEREKQQRDSQASAALGPIDDTVSDVAALRTEINRRLYPS